MENLEDGPGSDDPSLWPPQQTGQRKTRVGTGIKIAEENKEDPEPTGAPQPTVVYRRKDGTTYDKPPGKDATDHPTLNVVIELDENGEEVFSGRPVFKDQYSNPLWNRTYEVGPPEIGQFDLGNPEDLSLYQGLLKDSEPIGCPMVVFMGNGVQQFDTNTGNFKILRIWRRIRYKKILLPGKTL